MATKKTTKKMPAAKGKMPMFGGKQAPAFGAKGKMPVKPAKKNCK